MTAPTAAEPTPAEVADHIDAAAALIERDGLHSGDWWPGEFSHRPGLPCCTAAALAVSVLGERVVGYQVADFANNEDDDEMAPHPAFAALRAELGFSTSQELFDWSDETGAGQVVASLRAASTSIRLRNAFRTASPA